MGHERGTKEQETKGWKGDVDGGGDGTERRKVRVEEFLGSSRPRYAGKSEIDWEGSRPVSGRLRDVDIDADAGVGPLGR